MTTTWLTTKELLRLKKQEMCFEEVVFEFESETWSFYLDQRFQESVPPYQTAVRGFVDNFLMSGNPQENLALAIRLKNEALQISEQIHKLKLLGQRLGILSLSPEASDQQGDQVERLWNELKDWNRDFVTVWSQYRDQNHRLERALESTPKSAFEAIRLVKPAMVEIEQVGDIRVRLSQELCHYLEEKGQSHVGKTEINI